MQKKSNKRVTHCCDVRVSLTTHNQTKIEAVVKKLCPFRISTFLKVLMDETKAVLETKEYQVIARGY